MVATGAATGMASAGSGGGSGASGTGNVHKYYSRIDKLKEEEWKEWHYQFLVATHAYNVKNGALLEIVEEKELDEITTGCLEHELNQNESDWMHKTKAELFGVLTLLTKGEANQLVRGVDDKNGYVAWKRLYDRYNPKTPASLTAAWREVIRPKRVKDLREASKAIDAWEVKVQILKKEHAEEPTTGLKASLLLEMLPDAVQLTVAQGLSTKKLDYDQLKAKIKLMSNVHMDYCTPKPMDVDEAVEQYVDWESDWVDAVGKGKGKGKSRGPIYGACWTCGGPHYSNECPKGQTNLKGNQKGEGKAKGKGKSRGPMYGSCWTCGGAHYQSECPSGGKGGGSNGFGKGKGKAVGEVEDEEDEEGVESVSESWQIFGLEEPEAGRRAKRMGTRGTREEDKGIMLKNRFELLADIDETNSEDFDGDVDIDCASGGNCTAEGDIEVTIDCVVPGCGSQAATPRRGRWRRRREKEEEKEEEWIDWVADKHANAAAEIVVDSGAAESVCPWHWAEEFPMRAVAPDKKRTFLNASGGRMEHYGERRIKCGVNGLKDPVSMLFQVCDAKNALASVARITENGSIVQFGPKPDDNYILNPTTGDKVGMRRKGRRFVLDVDFVSPASFSRQV